MNNKLLIWFLLLANQFNFAGVSIFQNRLDQLVRHGYKLIVPGRNLDFDYVKFKQLERKYLGAQDKLIDSLLKKHAVKQIAFKRFDCLAFSSAIEDHHESVSKLDSAQLAFLARRLARCGVKLEKLLIKVVPSSATYYMQVSSQFGLFNNLEINQAVFDLNSIPQRHFFESILAHEAAHIVKKDILFNHDIYAINQAMEQRADLWGVFKGPNPLGFARAIQGDANSKSIYAHRSSCYWQKLNSDLKKVYHSKFETELIGGVRYPKIEHLF